ncbi:MAG: universal stress protein [Rhodospirillaceae bacterium]
MIQSILVPFGGSARDAEVFSGAVLIGRRLGAHLDFYHVNISAGEAAASMPHADFAMGAALREMLTGLRIELQDRSEKARLHFDANCMRDHVPRLDLARPHVGVTASWIEDNDHAVDHLLIRSRCRDLTIVARPRAGDRLPRDLLELLVIGSGRPMLVLPDDGALRAPETILVCWKDTPESARAAAGALPFLRTAKRVVVVAVQETPEAASGLADFLRQLAWHGITADAISLAHKPEDVAGALFAAAERIDADLMVMGAYGHTRTREILFGGVSHKALTGGARGILLAH